MSYAEAYSAYGAPRHDGGPPNADAERETAQNRVRNRYIRQHRTPISDLETFSGEQQQQHQQHQQHQQQQQQQRQQAQRPRVIPLSELPPPPPPPGQVQKYQQMQRRQRQQQPEGFRLSNYQKYHPGGISAGAVANRIFRQPSDYIRALDDPKDQLHTVAASLLSRKTISDTEKVIYILIVVALLVVIGILLYKILKKKRSI